VGWGGSRPGVRVEPTAGPPRLLPTFPVRFARSENARGNSNGGACWAQHLASGPPHPLINPTVGRLLQNKHIAAGINAMPISYARAGLKGLEETGGSSCHDVRNCQALMPTASRRERILAQCKALADIGSPSQSFIHVASEKMGVKHSIQLQQL